MPTDAPRHTSPSLPRPPGNSRLSSKAQQEALEWHQSCPYCTSHYGPCVHWVLSARFHPRRPQHCPECGANPQTVGHVIQHCPRFARARATYLAFAAPDLSSSSLFGTKEGGEALINVLEVTGPASDPMNRPLARDNLSPYLHLPPSVTCHLMYLTTQETVPCRQSEWCINCI
jgi:hypothetical protein